MDLKEYKELVKKNTSEPDDNKQIWTKDASLCMLFIEFREMDIIPDNLRNICNIYGGTNTSLVIVHSSENKEQIYETTKNWKNVVYIQESEKNITLEYYQKLITSETFWKKFQNYKYVLTNTWDSYIFKKIPEKFFEYDYVGGPCGHNYVIRQGQILNLCHDKCKCGSCIRKISTFDYHPYEHIYYMFNGGFCLRNVNRTIELCKKKRHMGEPEDVYFSLSYLDKPSKREASEFGIQDFEYDDPVGCHKIWESHTKEYIIKLFN